MGHRSRTWSRVCAALVAVLAFGALVVVAPAPAAHAAAEEDRVFELVNAQRQAAGRAPLVRDTTIEAAAEEWANHMGTLQTPLTHSSSQWRASRIPPGWYANGENIAQGYTSADAVMAGWMNSDGHRTNILSGSYTRIGIGYAQTPKGRMWVQIFAGYTSNPAPPAQPLSPTPTPTVAGSASVGAVLTATAGTWGPGSVSLAYQWKVGGTAIAGATGADFVPGQSAAGKTVTVTVTGSRPGYVTTARTSAPTAAVTSPFAAVDRVAGADRYAGAIAVSQTGYPSGAPVVYLATGANYPDALSAGPAAAKQGGPLLLTPGDRVPPGVLEEIVRLGPADIVIVGGTASVSAALEQRLAVDLADRGVEAEIRRIAGVDRFEASRRIVDEAFGGTNPGTVYVATGLNFPDALSAGAAGGPSGSPVLLVDGSASGIDPDSSAALIGLGAGSVTIAGGPRSVSPGVMTGISAFAEVRRISGADRYAASTAITLDAFEAADTAYLATGANFPDALAGSALAVAQQAPLFVVPPDCVPRATLGALRSLGVERVVLLGGPASLAPAVQDLSACPW